MSTFITADMLAAQSLKIVKGNIVAGMLFNNEIEQNFGKNPKTGNQVRIVRRKTLSPVSRASGADITPQNIVETNVTFNIQEELDTTVPIDVQELTLDIDPSELSSVTKLNSLMDNEVSRVVAPIAIGIAEELDTKLLAEVDNVPQSYPLAASLNFPSSLTDFGSIAAILNNKKVSSVNRFGIVTPDFYNAISNLLDKVNESGSSAGLREDVIGRLKNFNIVMDQHFPENVHTTGTMGTALVNNGAGYLAGTTSISLDTGDQATGTFLTGDTVSIAGYGNVIVATDVTAVANAVTITIKEPLRDDIVDNAAVVNYGVTGGTAISYKTVGYFGTRDCIAFASIAPLVEGPGVQSTSLNDNGFGINANLFYNGINKSTNISMSSLFGTKMLDGRMGVKVILKLA